MKKCAFCRKRHRGANMKFSLPRHTAENLFEMLKRTITAVIGISLLAVVCYFSDTLAFPIVFGLLAVVGVYEMLGCVGMRRNFIVALSLYIMTVSVTVLSQTISSLSYFISAFASFLFCVLTILFAVSVLSEGKVPVDKACVSFVTCSYVVTGFISVIVLRRTPHGIYLYLLPFIVPWLSDTFAYFCGRLFGKHKLIPSVSPNKTVEGSIGGIVFGIAGCVGYGIAMSKIFDVAIHVWVFAVLGFLISVASQIGDLIFSLIKRRYGIKDYGFIFPGHGGVLDRFDSVVATAPLILVVYELLIKLGVIAI